MKLITLNNAEIVIQARNEKDYADAIKVAEKMAELDGIDIVAFEDDTLRAVLGSVWFNYQAAELKATYQQAKKETI